MRCRWYETACLEKKCNGEGLVSCKVRERGAIFDRMRKEYKKRTTRNPQQTKTICLSCLEKTSYDSKKCGAKHLNYTFSFHSNAGDRI